MTNATTIRSTTSTFNTSDVLSPAAKTTDVSQQDEQTDAKRTEITHKMVSGIVLGALLRSVSELL
jgi:hypothetical protein